MRAIGSAVAVVLFAGAAHAQDGCPIGRWIADDAALAAEIAAADPTVPAAGVTGSAVFDYAADGGLRIEMTGFAITMGVAGSGSTVTIAADGTDEGHWAVADGRLRLQPSVRGAALTIAVTAADGGDAGTVEMKGWLEAGSSPYRCGEVLEVDLPLGGGGRAVTWQFAKAGP
jgi:hypothetical protein